MAESFSLSLLRFKTADGDLHYCEKAGHLDPNTDSPELKSVFAPVWNWQLDGNYKKVSDSEKIIKAEMRKGSHVFFPASRREDPDWLNPRSLTVGLEDPSIKRFDNELAKPIRVETCTEENISWILDVFLDSLVDPNILRPNLSQQKATDLRNRQMLRQAKQNVERILQAILQDHTAELRLNLRHLTPSRLSIQLSNGQMIPSLQSLSEGQSQLFNLFTTIIRYGERDDINRSLRLSNITGIVLIDEIGAHLHPSLQYEVVSQLIKLFPKVQFIVSSHSPLFLFGMEKAFGPDKLTILELPTGRRISCEEFTEFKHTFEYYQDTESFNKQVEQRFADGTKPLVLTEGSLDVRYIQAALTLLEKDELLGSVDIEFVGIKEGNKESDGGDSGLDRFKKVYKAKSSLFHRPILLLYDCDTQKPKDQVEQLWVRSIPCNPENTKVKNGIENLFPTDLFEDCFYRKSSGKDGGYTMYLDKPKFCEWICETRKDANDFAKFDSIVQILEEFSEAHQSDSAQQE